MIKWKTLYNKSCRSCFIESRIVEFVFFLFVYDFISILQVHCLMLPVRQDLNVIFFTFRSCRPLDGRQTPCRQAPIFENFPIRHIFLKFCFFYIKMKKVPFPLFRFCLAQFALRFFWPSLLLPAWPVMRVISSFFFSPVYINENDTLCEKLSPVLVSLYVLIYDTIYASHHVVLISLVLSFYILNLCKKDV